MCGWLVCYGVWHHALPWHDSTRHTVAASMEVCALIVRPLSPERFGWAQCVQSGVDHHTMMPAA